MKTSDAVSRSQHNLTPCQSLLERSRFGCYYPPNHQFDGGDSDPRFGNGRTLEKRAISPPHDSSRCRAASIRWNISGPAKPSRLTGVVSSKKLFRLAQPIFRETLASVARPSNLSERNSFSFPRRQNPINCSLARGWNGLFPPLKVF